MGELCYFRRWPIFWMCGHAWRTWMHVYTLIWQTHNWTEHAGLIDSLCEGTREWRGSSLKALLRIAVARTKVSKSWAIPAQQTGPSGRSTHEWARVDTHSGHNIFVTLLLFRIFSLDMTVRSVMWIGCKILQDSDQTLLMTRGQGSF